MIPARPITEFSAVSVMLSTGSSGRGFFHSNRKRPTTPLRLEALHAQSALETVLVGAFHQSAIFSLEISGMTVCCPERKRIV